MQELVPPSELDDALLARGRYWATTGELVDMTGRSEASLRGSFARLKRDGRLFSPARGFYVMIPPEYRSWRVVPAEWFIDPMMEHLKRPYYVSFLNAAALHNASHQATQTLRVMTTQHVADRDIARVKLRFATSVLGASMPTERRVVHTGYMTVATPETTIVDLVWRPEFAGGLDNIATILLEIGELSGESLARLAPLHSRSIARRLGWLLERFRPDVDTHWLHVVARPAEGDPVPLAPGNRRGSLDRRWGVRVNTSVEPDA